MADPVIARLDGRWPDRHLKSLQYDIWIIMIGFGFAVDNAILLDELSARLRGLQKYSHLSRDEMKEMLAQVAGISFLFLSEIKNLDFVIIGRSNEYAVSKL